MTQLPTDEGGTGGPSDRPIFIVGCPRSGTTLLQLMLHAHPRIAIPPETRYLLETYRRREDFGDLTKRKNRRRVAEHIIGRRRHKVRDLKVRPKRLVASIAAGPPTIGSALGLVYVAYARRFDKPRWGDKRPVYLHHIPTLLALFPDAQIVHIIRDGRACAASLKRMRWWRRGSVAAIARWVHSMRDGRRARETLRSDQYYEFRYEDLVAEPEKTLRDLCAFLGEEFDEAMLEPHRVAQQAVPKRKQHHARTKEAVSGAKVASWAEELEPWEIALAEMVAGRWLREYGYTLTNPGVRPPVKAIAACYADLMRRRTATRRSRKRDRRRARRYDQPVAARLTSAQRAAVGG